MAQPNDSNDEFVPADITPGMSEQMMARVAAQQVALLVKKTAEDKEKDRKTTARLKKLVYGLIVGVVIAIAAGTIGVIGLIDHQNDINQLRQQNHTQSMIIKAQRDDLIARCEQGNSLRTGNYNSFKRLTDLLAPDNKITPAVKAVKDDYLKYVLTQNPQTNCAQVYPAPVPSAQASGK